MGGIWHRAGTSPLLCPSGWGVGGAGGPGLGVHGTSCLTAHSSQLPAPAAGAKPDWILNWKINPESCEPQPSALLLRQRPGCPHRLPAQAASPLLQMGKLRHKARSRDAPGAAEGSALSPPPSRTLCYFFLGGRHRSVLPEWPRAALFIYLQQPTALIPAGGAVAPTVGLVSASPQLLAATYRLPPGKADVRD